MNRYYKELELHKILEMLAGIASNERTKELCLAIEPSSDLYDVQQEIRKTSDTLDLTVRFGTPSFCGFKDVTPSLARAKSGAMLTFRELLNVAQLLNQIRSLTDWYKHCENVETSISFLFAGLTPNKYLEEKISTAIVSDEEMSDAASPELARIRRKISQSGARIREMLDKLIRSSTVQKSLQEAIVTLRDGRYVLPVKAEYKGNVPGLVHATSSSGQTLFIEPSSVVEANNDIRILQGKEQEEMERIVAELSAECAENAELIAQDYEACVILNLYFSKANLAAKMHASTPEISDDGELILKKARHPLIDKNTVVPVDIALGGKFQALIITGPNTGGKTVLLKTAGLLTAMTMCGLLIPVADGSKISVFKQILVDIGDWQSIEQSLSTFSSHINEIIRILEVADRSSLILLDELGSGTDPVEGAALAVSIIEQLKARGSRLLVTTHYQELKIYALRNDNIENASCEFDVATLRPTYKLIIGSPGKSNAFEISKRLGLSDSVIEYARTLVADEDKRFEEVVEQLERSRQELDAQNDEIRRLRNEQQANAEKLRHELEEIEANKEAELDKARAQALRIVESVRTQSQTLIDELDELRKKKEKENFTQLAIEARRTNKNTINRLYDEANPVSQRPKQEYVLPRPLKRGDNVLIFDIDKKGILASDPDAGGNVFVQAGIMKTRVHISKLRLLESEKVSYQNKRISTKDVRGVMQRKSSMELDIRGQNANEGLMEVDAFIDNAVMCGAGILTVIHGKGTGVLRKAVQAHLRQHPNVKSFRSGVYGEGEEGVTIIELK